MRVHILAACLLIQVCPLWAQGYRWRHMPGAAQQAADEPSLSTFATANFTGSGACAACHSGLVDQEGTDVSLDVHWRSTMMANAARDPLWQAKVSSETLRTPSRKTDIEATCARCHTPMAQRQARAQSREILLLGRSGCLHGSHPLHEVACDGVSCTLCHQIAGASLGTRASFSGNYHIDMRAAAPDRPVYGKFPDPFAGPMRMSVGYTPTRGGHVSDSSLCGACHVFYSQTLDASGKPTGKSFPEQTTYLEWAHAAKPYSPTCQDCHMPRAAGAVGVSNRPPWLAKRRPFSMHHFVGGNAFMLELLRDNRRSLQATAGGSQFDATIDRTLTQLGRTSARLRVSASRRQDRLHAVVKVENLAGHKLPSGIPIRRVWIHLAVKDDSGRMVWESGRCNANGRIDGNDADDDPLTFEPHHRTISRPDQVQIYEPVMADPEGRVTCTLTRAERYAKDNRLLPEGFDRRSSSADIADKGVGDDDDFRGGSDSVAYVLAIGPGRHTVTATLLYQSVGYRFMADLGRADTEAVRRFERMYEAADKSPAVLAWDSDEVD